MGVNFFSGEALENGQPNSQQQIRYIPDQQHCVEVSHTKTQESQSGQQSSDAIVIKISPDKTNVSSKSVNAKGNVPVKDTHEDSPERQKLIKTMKKIYPHEPW